MRVTTVLLSLLGLATGKSIKVESGQRGLTFDPSTIKADVGDTLEFIFFPQNHSVAQGDFDRPCQPAPAGTGFHSGFVPVSKGEADMKFVVRINTTDPIFFYCPAAGHCRSGMVGVVNPSGDKTLDAYQKAAHNVHEEGVPVGVYGGQFVRNDDDGSSSSNSVTSTSTSPNKTLPPITGSFTSATQSSTSGTNTAATTGTTTGATTSTTTSNAAAGAYVGSGFNSFIAVIIVTFAGIIMGSSLFF